ncbi:MAG: hypothetical protein KJ052_02405 [Candidatus Hydrogenedentes bacterium]|nr:hypothetical protein [Candidatus Hydrogenedentota bacterium]
MRVYLSVVFIFLLTMENAVSQETLESLEQHLGEQWEKISAFTAQVKMTADITAKGIRMNTAMEGPMVLERLPDGSSRYRTEMDGNIKIGPFGLINFDTKSLMVSDGDVLYSETRSMNKITVTKSRADAKPEDAPGGGSSKLAAARKKFDLKVLPEETLRGRPVYVLQGKPKEAQQPDSPVQIDRALFYFDKATGIQLRISVFDTADNVITQLDFNNIRLNPRVDPKQFDYTPPTGAEIIDNTVQPAVE